MKAIDDAIKERDEIIKEKDEEIKEIIKEIDEKIKELKIMSLNFIMNYLINGKNIRRIKG